MVTDVTRITAPTEMDHYQLRRTIDVYITTKTEALGGVAHGVQRIIDQTNKPAGVRISLKGSVQAMNSSFSSFGFGLLLAVLLVYLVLVAQFRSFLDPFLIMLAVPPGIMGVILILATDRNDAEHHVADGHCHDGRYRGFQQHPDRGIHPPPHRG